MSAAGLAKLKADVRIAMTVLVTLVEQHPRGDEIIAGLERFAKESDVPLLYSELPAVEIDAMHEAMAKFVTACRMAQTGTRG